MVGGRRRQRLRRGRAGAGHPALRRRALRHPRSPGRSSPPARSSRRPSWRRSSTTAIPAATRRTGGHPAKRTFQAIRIEVNAELEVLPAAPRRRHRRHRARRPHRRALVPLGRGPHRQGPLPPAGPAACDCPPGLPCVCDAVQTVRLVRGVPKRPSAAEQARQPPRRIGPAAGRRAHRAADRRRQGRSLTWRRPFRPPRRRPAPDGHRARRRRPRPPARGAAEITRPRRPASRPTALVPRRRVAINAAVVLGFVAIVVLMLGTVVLHTRLAERQVEIDRLEQDVTDARDRFDVLRQQRAELRSPTRLAIEAERLRMIPAPRTEFLDVDPQTWPRCWPAPASSTRPPARSAPRIRSSRSARSRPPRSRAADGPLPPGRTSGAPRRGGAATARRARGPGRPPRRPPPARTDPTSCHDGSARRWAAGPIRLGAGGPPGSRLRRSGGPTR